MSKIVALRGYDTGCGCSGLGADATPPAMSPMTMALWAISIGTAGYIFWATLQKPKRRKRAA